MMMRLFLSSSLCEATGDQKKNEIATIDDIDSSGVTYGSSKSYIHTCLITLFSIFFHPDINIPDRNPYVITG